MCTKKKLNKKKEKRPIKSKNENNFLHCDEFNESDTSDCSEIGLFNLSDGNQNRFVMKLNVNNCDIEFEIDTGASLSVCSESLYKKYFSNLTVNKTNIVLKSYDGSIIKPSGSVNVCVKVEEKI